MTDERKAISITIPGELLQQITEMSDEKYGKRRLSYFVSDLLQAAISAGLSDGLTGSTGQQSITGLLPADDRLMSLQEQIDDLNARLSALETRRPVSRPAAGKRTKPLAEGEIEISEEIRAALQDARDSGILISADFARIVKEDASGKNSVLKRLIEGETKRLPKEEYDRMINLLQQNENLL